MLVVFGFVVNGFLVVFFWFCKVFIVMFESMFMISARFFFDFLVLMILVCNFVRFVVSNV